VGRKKFNAIYETPTIVLVIDFVRRWLSASIGLVRRQRRARYSDDPQNDWNEFTRILMRHSWSFQVRKQDAQARYPKAERRTGATGHVGLETEFA
jgi:hypothetical protein